MGERAPGECSAGRLARWLDGFTDRHGLGVATASATEVQLIGVDGACAWLEVPFPPLPTIVSGTDPREVLVAHTARLRTVGVILVRRRGHAIGVFTGSDLVASKVDSAYVQGTTRAAPLAPDSLPRARSTGGRPIGWRHRPLRYSFRAGRRPAGR